MDSRFAFKDFVVVVLLVLLIVVAALNMAGAGRQSEQLDAMKTDIAQLAKEAERLGGEVTRLTELQAAMATQPEQAVEGE